MRLRSCFAVPALVAAFVVSACSSGGSGNRTTYNSGGTVYGSRQAASAPVPYAQAAPSASYSRSGRGNTAYIIMTGGCHFCQKLRSETLPDGGVRAELASLNSQQIDADTASGRAIANQYHVTGYPTTVVVNSSGSVVKQIRGFYGPNDYVSQLRQAH